MQHLISLTAAHIPVVGIESHTVHEATEIVDKKTALLSSRGSNGTPDDVDNARTLDLIRLLRSMQLERYSAQT